MKIKWLAGVLLTAITISACDENTQGIGSSLEGDIDRFTILTDTFEVTSRSIIIDSVLARGSSCYLGCMKDPERSTPGTAAFCTKGTLSKDSMKARERSTRTGSLSMKECSGQGIPRGPAKATMTVP